MNTVTNTVVLVRNVLTKQIIAALASAPVKPDANTTVEEATVYGPTAYNRFIHNGRYLAKEVVAQVWDVLTTGEAVSCPAPKRARKPRSAKPTFDKAFVDQADAALNPQADAGKDLARKVVAAKTAEAA